MITPSINIHMHIRLFSDNNEGIEKGKKKSTTPVRVVKSCKAAPKSVNHLLEYREETRAKKNQTRSLTFQGFMLKYHNPKKGPCWK